MLQLHCLNSYCVISFIFYVSYQYQPLYIHTFSHHTTNTIIEELYSFPIIGLAKRHIFVPFIHP